MIDFTLAVIGTYRYQAIRPSIFNIPGTPDP